MSGLNVLFSLTVYPCSVPAVQPNMTQIVGEQIANRGSWPWTVSIYSRLIDKSK